MPVAHGPAPDHHDSAPSSGPPVVFVSYCREDAEWLPRFAEMLKPEVRNRPPARLWHDTLNAAGRQWRPELEDAIGRTVVALLLVTPEFLASDFIMRTELPALEKAGAELVPVLVRGCSDWTAIDALKRVRWAREPGRDQPVAALRNGQVDDAIAGTTRAVVVALDRRLGETAAPAATDAGHARGVQLPAVEPKGELVKPDEPARTRSPEELAHIRTIFASLAGLAAAAVTVSVNRDAPPWLLVLLGLGALFASTVCLVAILEWRRSRPAGSDAMARKRRAVVAVVATAAVAAGAVLVIVVVPSDEHGTPIPIDRRAGTGPYAVSGSCHNRTCFLYERAQPSLASKKLARIKEGALLTIVCQVRGGKVSVDHRASRIWDQLYDRRTGPYVSDLFVDTPAVGRFTKGIPRCPQRPAA
jgi:hypothetical protein